MPEILHPTHVPFLDSILGGGTAPLGVYGILGPTGVGKTHLASMIATNAATKGSYFHPDALAAKPWLLVDIETQRIFCLKRVLSHVAKIEREHVLHRSIVIQNYEYSRQAELQKSGGHIATEEQRSQDAIKVLNKKFHLLSADDIYKYDSQGELIVPENFLEWLTQEIQLLNEELSADGTTLGGIVIDGVSNVWNLSRKFSALNEHDFIQDFVDNYCRGLSEKYQCLVWVTHQVNGAACEASPLTLLLDSDAARCKTFAQNLDACFVLGTPSPNNLFSIRCTRGKSESIDPNYWLLTHDNDFATIVEVHNYFEDKIYQTWKESIEMKSRFNNIELEHLDKMLAECQQQSES